MFRVTIAVNTQFALDLIAEGSKVALHRKC